jgi:hypothetical protein
MTALLRGPLVAIAAGLLLTACPAPRKATCAIAPSPSGSAYLVRASALGAGTLPPAESPGGYICKRSPRYKCHEVDELDAVLRGGAQTASPEGQSFVRVCPSLPKVEYEPAWRTDKPCGDRAGDNVQVAITSGTQRLHLLFYEDPSCREPFPGGNQAPRQTGYYRVREVLGMEWTGDGW